MISTLRGDTRRWKSALVLALGLILAGTGCSDDFLLSASDLEIGPDPASPGDAMVATLLVTLIPTQHHTYVLFIDEEEHLRVSSDEQPAIPVIIELGDAAALIDAYGTGAHTAYVEVRLDDSGRSARTAWVEFTLQAAEPQEEP
ncbi:MAG TPA: hypothetical protein VMM12_01645 [Longimicrobiales bacterium]|nr:hypothetical protein [Longimicrobiales bacterium]